MVKSLTSKIAATCTALLLITVATLSHAGGCIEGGCHAKQMESKHLHGPLAAEESMGNGCVQCHLPDGKDCSTSTGGKYTYMVPLEAMCTNCHDKGESPGHVELMKKCLDCHSPHGSDVSPFMVRAQ